MADHESLRQAQLERMRAIALALLLAMALLLVLARRMEAGHALWAYVAAFAEAAMVGGLADWFAVSALFRHPLGLKIPHTAIIPNNKERIGESIANFLQYNFMTREVLRDELAQVDFAGAAAAWLAEPARCAELAGTLARAVPGVLQSLDDDSVRRFMRAALAGSLGSVRLGPALAQLLTLLVGGRQHHILLERILGVAARALEQNRPYLRQKVHENSPRWLPKAIDDKLLERMLDGVQTILIEIQGEDSAWRARFDQATHGLIEQLAHSQEYEAKLHQLLARSLGHPAFHEYLGQVLSDIKARLIEDAGASASVLASRLAQSMAALAAALQADPALRLRINAWLRTLAADAIVERRDVIASVVRRVIRTWDADTVTRKFELQVGKDLQFIRINGTLVGGSVGVLLHAFSAAMRG